MPRRIKGQDCNPYESIRGMWECAYVSQFIRLFQGKLNFVSFATQDLEDGLVDCKCLFIPDVCARLLRYLTGQTDILISNFESYFKQLLIENHAESNPLQDASWNELAPEERLTLVKWLVDYVYQEKDEDMTDFLDDYFEADDMRGSMVGQDAFNNIYWYFDDLRLYRENSVKKPSKKDWELVCHNLSDWHSFLKQFRKTSNPQERELFTYLNDELFPLIEGQLEIQEEERKKKNDLEKNKVLQQEKEQIRSMLKEAGLPDPLPEELVIKKEESEGNNEECSNLESKISLAEPVQAQLSQPQQQTIQQNQPQVAQQSPAPLQQQSQASPCTNSRAANACPENGDLKGNSGVSVHPGGNSENHTEAVEIVHIKEEKLSPMLIIPTSKPDEKPEHPDCPVMHNIIPHQEPSMMPPAACVHPTGMSGAVPGLINKQTVNMEAQYMQQQSQIFVFSTTLANKAAEAVLQGHFPSIIAFHCAQPGTKRFLEKHPLKTQQFTRNSPAAWLNSMAQAKQNKSKLQHPFGMMNDQFPPVNHWLQSHIPQHNPTWQSPQQITPQHMSPQPPPTQLSKIPDENLTPQQRQHREEQLAMIRKMQQLLFPDQHQNTAPEMMMQDPMMQRGNMMSPQNMMISPGNNMYPMSNMMSSHQVSPSMRMMASQSSMSPGPIMSPTQKSVMVSFSPQQHQNQPSPASIAAQMEWQGLQQQFCDEGNKQQQKGMQSSPQPQNVMSPMQGPPPPYSQVQRTTKTSIPSSSPVSPSMTIPSPRMSATYTPTSSGEQSPQMMFQTQQRMPTPGGVKSQQPAKQQIAQNPVGSPQTPTHSIGMNVSTPSSVPYEPTSTMMPSPSISQKSPGIGYTRNMHSPQMIQQNPEFTQMPTQNNQLPSNADSMFGRTLQSYAQQSSQRQKEASLMPVPSPQQIQYLNTFEGQELTIQKQPNLSYATMASPTIGVANMASPTIGTPVEHMPSQYQQTMSSNQHKFPGNFSRGISGAGEISEYPSPPSITPQHSVGHLQGQRLSHFDPHSPRSHSGSSTTATFTQAQNMMANMTSVNVGSNGSNSGSVPNYQSNVQTVQNIQQNLEPQPMSGPGPQTVNNTYVNATMSIQQLNIQNVPTSAYNPTMQMQQINVIQPQQQVMSPVPTGSPMGTSVSTQQGMLPSNTSMMITSSSPQQRPQIMIQAGLSSNHPYCQTNSNSSFNGANVQVKASAPNTIQYLPAKPQSNTRVHNPRPPSLDFLQRFASPLTNLDSKVPTQNLQYFPRGMQNQTMPNMSTMSGAQNSAQPSSRQTSQMARNTNLQNMFMNPMFNQSRQSEPQVMFSVPSPGLVPSQYGQQQQQFSAKQSSMHSSIMNPELGGVMSPTMSQTQSVSFKQPSYYQPTPSDPNYAVQFHNFQQQLYATNTRQNQSNVASQSFHGPK